MSNVYKFSQVENDKKVIVTKPIAVQPKEPSVEESQTLESEMDELIRQRDGLIQEIQELQTRKSELADELTIEREKFLHELHELKENQENEMRIQADTIYTESNQQGFEQGYETGYQQGMQEWVEKNQEIQQIITLAYEEKQTIIQEAEPFLLDLSVQIAKKILHVELELHPEKVVDMIKKCLLQVSERQEVVLQVAPTSYPIVQGQVEELKQFIEPSAELRVVPDQTYSGLGCMIHTPHGSFDVTLDSQLAEIKKHLLSYFEESAEQ
ncbi:FliH/SctL family protein [Caldalkalibacillus mannanilyticus]|uniref:FliH/SctL family protein n=1 Tax=Caldalkalibacillus mannanilyticus TaxID=1418 RepID=UPI000469A150|nr:FliH/SctL family protein [Caldalkalibacillus mannanilyticus]